MTGSTGTGAEARPRAVPRPRRRPRGGRRTACGGAAVAAALALAAALAALAALPAAVMAKTYPDVPPGHWAYRYIDAVTDRSAAGKRLLDDYRTVFRPERAITREQLARTLVLASGHYGDEFTPVEIPDVPVGYRYYRVIQLAVALKLMSVDSRGCFQPTKAVTAAKAEAAVVRWLKLRYPSADWTLLRSLRPSVWEPDEGWTTGAPSYLPWVVAARQLRLRYNHPAGEDGEEVAPTQPVDRAEVAYMLYRGYQLADEWTMAGLADLATVTFGPLSERQRQVARLALKYVGYPYVWGGEYPTPDSPYGPQAAGGFDCSGFVFYVMKLRLGYPLTDAERGASDMARNARPRLRRDELACGDLVFFGPDGPDSKAADIYHAGLYLGNGWFIHSTGSSDGVTLCSLDRSSYWKAAFAWGRRLLTPEELAVGSDQ